MQDYCKTTQDTNVMQIMTQITMKVWESLQEGQAVVNEKGESLYLQYLLSDSELVGLL